MRLAAGMIVPKEYGGLFRPVRPLEKSVVVGPNVFCGRALQTPTMKGEPRHGDTSINRCTRNAVACSARSYYLLVCKAT